jgi:hypothetical protein
MMGEKRFIWGVNLYRIIGALVGVISSDTKELQTNCTMLSMKTTAQKRQFARYFKELGFPDGN